MRLLRCSIPSIPSPTLSRVLRRSITPLLALFTLVPAPARAAEAESLVREMLAQPPGGRGDGGAMALYGRAFAGYALVNDGLDDPARRPEIAALLDRLIEQVASPPSGRPFRLGTVRIAGRALSPSVAHRGHLALLLVGRARLGPLAPAAQTLLHDLARSLARDIEQSPTHLLRTYDGTRIWPADNEVVAAALALYLRHVERDPLVERAFGTLQSTLRSLERPGWRSTGLPASALRAGTTRLVAIDVPRGCALSWTVAMRGLYDPDAARDLYVRYRAHFWTDWGVIVGLREWPPGIDRRPDTDSGPIIGGIGLAASGIGVGAARITASTVDEARLRVAASAAGQSLVKSVHHRTLWSAQAIAAWARTARTW